jgi:hypothetical protein
MLHRAGWYLVTDVSGQHLQGSSDIDTLLHSFNVFQVSKKFFLLQTKINAFDVTLLLMAFQKLLEKNWLSILTDPDVRDYAN